MTRVEEKEDNALLSVGGKFDSGPEGTGRVTRAAGLHKCDTHPRALGTSGIKKKKKKNQKDERAGSR